MVPALVFAEMIEKSFFRTANWWSAWMSSNRESRVQIKFSDLPSISKEMTESSEITMGRTFRLCGATGVMTKFLESGKTIGPPQLKEYPVEPVGVAMMMPSAQYELR